ncbi:MAG: VTT domain-containing protein [Candidatus Lernaella stagnicola]|nr:VTT domain-containing protein [Candidatus Lernaella stagnicola]
MQTPRHVAWIVAKALLVVVFLAILAVLVWRHNLPFADLRDMIRVETDKLGLFLSTLLFIVLYMLISTVPIPGREVFKLAAAVTFGYFSIVAVWWGEVLAGVVGFGLARFGGFELVKFLGGARVTDFNDTLRGATWKSITFLRIIPITPYRFFNFGAGLLDVRFGPYLSGTVLGTLVRTAIFQIIFVLFSDILIRQGVSIREVFFASIVFGSLMILSWIVLHRRRRKQATESEA